MIFPEEYFKTHNLFDLETLKAHAEQNSVRVITSERFPHLVMLHYREDCVFENIWPEFAKMCRGLIVDMKNQIVLSHPFEKFFNLDQQPEISYDLLKDKKDFEISEKLDGSMLILFKNPADSQYYLTTKGSFDSEHGRFATSIIPESLKQDKWVNDYTLMFELISSQFRIVIDYKKKGYAEGLYLIGARDRHTNRLLTYAEVGVLAKELGIGAPNTYKFDSLDQLIERTKEMPLTEEGFVLHYPDGLMVKVKGAAYLKAHKFISHLSDKNILLAVSEGLEDPFVEICPDEFREEVIEKIAYFKSRKVDILNQCYQYYADAPKDQDRKTFALWVNANVKPSLKGCMFQLLDCHPLKDKELYDIISKTEKPSVETRI